MFSNKFVTAMESRDYCDRVYLSAIEVAKFLGITVRQVHELVDKGILTAQKAASGQKRFSLQDVKRLLEKLECDHRIPRVKFLSSPSKKEYEILVGDTVQRLYVANSQSMSHLADNSIHLVVTSPPYFDAKMYAPEPIHGDLGNIHTLSEWLDAIAHVWREVFRVLQPGRKAFINIMNLPIRTPNRSFRTLNLVGKTIDLFEELGFIFKREIIWHKTNSVRAHFGTYPYPGGILINHMHEFILEFEKPAPPRYNKYAHLKNEQKEKSKLSRDFWIAIKKSDVWTIKPEGSGDKRSHVAPFPEEIPYRLIKAYSYVGETILDPFVGSGTTLIAAAKLQRNGVGYEINPVIAEEAVMRIKNIQLCMDL